MRFPSWLIGDLNRSEIRGARVATINSTKSDPKRRPTGLRCGCVHRPPPGAGDDLLDEDDDLEPDRMDDGYLDILAELSRTAVESGNDRYFTDYAFEEACALDGPSSADTMDRGEDR